MVPYVIKQGDFLARLALTESFDADAVWSHSKNATLKKARKDPNMLQPGDVLYVPEPKRKFLPVSVGSTNKYSATVPQVTISVRFVSDGQPLAGEPYELEGLPAATDGGDASDLPTATDGNGGVTLQVPMLLKSFNIRFVNRDEVHTVFVGHLDPPDEPSGAHMRLGMLGMFGRPGGAAQISGPDEMLERGLRRFQRLNKLDVTGQLDDKTSAKLVEIFGR